MATQQEVIDVQYDIKLAEQQQKLREIFSEAILGWARLEGLDSFMKMKEYSGSINLSFTKKRELKGLSYFNNATSLFVNNSELTEIGDISGLNQLTEFRCNDNPLTYVGDISEMVSLTDLYIHTTQISSIGDLRELVRLRRFVATNCSLSNIGSLSKLYNLEWMYLGGNDFAVTEVNSMLRNMADVAAYQSANGGVVLTIVALEGGTNAAPTGDGLTAVSELTALGVTVTYNS